MAVLVAETWVRPSWAMWWIRISANVPESAIARWSSRSWHFAHRGYSLWTWQPRQPRSFLMGNWLSMRHGNWPINLSASYLIANMRLDKQCGKKKVLVEVAKVGLWMWVHTCIYSGRSSIEGSRIGWNPAQGMSGLGMNRPWFRLAAYLVYIGTPMCWWSLMTALIPRLRHWMKGNEWRWHQ